MLDVMQFMKDACVYACVAVETLKLSETCFSVSNLKDIILHFLEF